MSMKIYHNPRCSKSRQTLALLESKNIAPEVVLYLEQPPQPSELKELLQKLSMNAEQLVRKKEALFKQLSLKGASEQQLIQAMSEHPKLIERPIVIKGNQAVLGRPPENINKLI